MTPLTPRQKQVMAELCAGVPLVDIANRTCIAPRQVHSIRRSLFRKLGVQSRRELRAYDSKLKANTA